MKSPLSQIDAWRACLDQAKGSTIRGAAAAWIALPLLWLWEYSTRHTTNHECTDSDVLCCRGRRELRESSSIVWSKDFLVCVAVKGLNKNWPFSDGFHITCIRLQKYLLANLFAKVSILGARKCHSWSVRPYRGWTIYYLLFSKFWIGIINGPRSFYLCQSPITLPALPKYIICTLLIVALINPFNSFISFFAKKRNYQKPDPLTSYVFSGSKLPNEYMLCAAGLNIQCETTKK